MAMSKRRLLVLRVAAVTCSILLVGGFISYRATGHVIPGMAERNTPAPTRVNNTIQSSNRAQQQSVELGDSAIMPGSKFSTVVDKEVFMGGSKSARAFTPEDEAALGILEATERGVVWDPDKALNENPSESDSPDSEKP